MISFTPTNVVEDLEVPEIFVHWSIGNQKIAEIFAKLINSNTCAHIKVEYDLRPRHWGDKIGSYAI